MKKPDTTRHISFIPSSDDLIEKVMEEDDLKEKMGEEDDLIEKVVDENMKTSLDGQREIDLKLHHTDNNVEDTKHINRKESTGIISPYFNVLINTIALGKGGLH